MQELFSSADQGVFLACIERAQAIACGSGLAVIAGIQRPMEDIDFLPLLGASHGDCFFCEYPDRQQALLGLGSVAEIVATGESRFRDASAASELLFSHQQLDGFGEQAELRPLLLGGFSFWAQSAGDGSPWQNFPPAKLVLPEFLFGRCCYEQGDEQGKVQSTFSLFVRVFPDSNAPQLLATALNNIAELKAYIEFPAKGLPVSRDSNCCKPSADFEQQYRSSVESLLNEIEQGAIKKAVLARSCRVSCQFDFIPVDMLLSLRENYPSCFVFAVLSKGSAFVGASPERLLSLKDDKVISEPVAGSIRRGVDSAEDQNLAKQLLQSEKERVEHSIVVQGIQSELKEFCVSLDTVDSPRVLKLPGIQHLYTKIQGVLEKSLREKSVHKRAILEILDKLHPTAAVGGAPKSQALAWLKEHEDLDRGWYTGPVGWINDRGEGDFYIALRAALLRANEALLYAGAGIVAGSKSECELKETELKMRAALNSILELNT